MQPIACGISDFETLVTNHYLYVDKTEYLWKLVRNVGEAFFLARPRRFGKSLTLSTIKAIFQGKRHLFEGLAIAEKEYDWKAYPIIHIDLGNFMGIGAKAVETYLFDIVEGLA